MLNPTRQPKDTRTALDAFLAHKATIDTLLEELTKRSTEHFDADPEAINWTDVAGLARLSDALKDACDSAP
ncbi:hypothetical protein [Neogemmobacter tilapiae]|uniref:Uncharacterized protein n=1 Tax=Neogemmobacter tilapiae TaxID=875041 RepID=A0A918TYY0_9RHOB|nr:hypothetical protein [Gemmobacter tilapiae]GHC66454.1 hypothetical protein GCM10007315_34000 [Gemmobacter tilapiae]